MIGGGYRKGGRGRSMIGRGKRCGYLSWVQRSPSTATLR